jgi:ceramide glucosyltransferase
MPAHRTNAAWGGVIVAIIAAAISVVGIAQAAAGWIAVRRFADRVAATRRERPYAAGILPAVTVLKPLHGDEPLLEEALASACRQDYPIFQIVFGVSELDDTALPVVQRLRAEFGETDMAVVTDATLHGENRKVGNLINMLRAAKHDVLVIADSDIHVASDWLRRLVLALAEPQVGLVTTIYTGRPASGFFGRLGALQINQYFLPGAILARVMGRQDCLGATMMLRRKTLERIGGLQALVNHLADDNVLGRLVQQLGLRVALGETVPATTVPEATLPALWWHELRWARTIRALAPLPFAASVLQYPLAWAVLAVVLAGARPVSLAWFGIAWCVRALAVHGIDKALGLAKRSPLWLLPLRELMSVAVMAASYACRRVDWRGYTLQAEGFDPR